MAQPSAWGMGAVPSCKLIQLYEFAAGAVTQASVANASTVWNEAMHTLYCFHNALAVSLLTLSALGCKCPKESCLQTVTRPCKACYCSTTSIHAPSQILKLKILDERHCVMYLLTLAELPYCVSSCWPIMLHGGYQCTVLNTRPHNCNDLIESAGAARYDERPY